MVKWRWLLCTALLASCALIDAATGDGKDDEEPIIVIDDDRNNDVDPNHDNFDPNNDVFTPIECAWWQCPCALTGCDPATDCTSFGCSSCLDDNDCMPGDVCQFSGRCGQCETYGFSVGDYYESNAGEVYVCEVDSFNHYQFCLRLACFPEFQL